MQTKGLRQGCPLSPLLFALYISDLDKVLHGARDGGVVINNRLKTYSLAYADDLVLLAESPADMRGMLKTLNTYAQKRDLHINYEKSKVMRFTKGGHMSREKWEITGQTLEEVRTFKYLGFTFQISGKHDAHIQDMVSSGKRAVSRAWSICERRFPSHFRIRKQMFESVVVPTMTYGCEVTGYRVWEAIEAQARKYFKWTLGLHKGTKTTILYEETKSQPIYLETGRRAMSFEERAVQSSSEILRLSVLESFKEKNVDRESYCNRTGYSWAAIREWLTSGITVSKALKERDKDVFLQLQNVKLDSLRYAKVRPQSMPLYLFHSHPEYKMIARFRCENEERARQSWRDDRLCRVCMKEEETLEHMKDCIGVERVELLLDERGRGTQGLRNILQCRERRGHEGE